jgi:tetratricopeptide (TPR) repeat protein
MHRISFTTTYPGADRRHFVDEDDVLTVLARLPAEAISRCRAVHFNDRSRGGRVLGYTNQGRREIALTALPPRISLGGALVPPQRAETFGARKSVPWPPLAVRRFVLYDVLLHEIGHLQVVHPSARHARRKFAMEPRAESFADAWRERLWAEPLDHEDPVHRAPPPEELAALARYPEAHEAYRRGLSTHGTAKLAHFERAMELFPGHALALEQLGWDAALDGDARKEDAARYLQAALRVDPLLPMANIAFSMTLLRMDRPIEARRHLERAMKHVRLSALGLRDYANSLADAGFLARAERFFQRALEKDPDDVASFIDYAWTLWELGAATEEIEAQAVALLERAVAMAPASARAHEALAQALASRPGEASRALHHAEEALRLRPDDKDAARLVERLRRPLPAGRATHSVRKTRPERPFPR